ncbi:putative dienelactone hydrolase [Streptosporangium becharense]|uniref:Putative dienelactone hydrolase n=1 Tax=Streptosporangium becharense TaxID=1816182 RepID=A0A7W9IG68_9ACTN|nr:alpha/beta hydrolase [Streptosporangium becharense]MBB2908842.1 putative dienelactone hydrolase [Streptosporangium becharense]MBB5820140.1 putative dienelactone hydrolase [Streptosporangium becharense]
MKIKIMRGVGVAGAVTASMLALLATVPAQAASPPRTGTVPDKSLTLPAPTGSHPVGTVSLHLVDRSRPDPWVATEKTRQLMVSLWYPAAKGAGRPAQYMTDEEAKAFLEGQKVTDVPSEVVSGTRTHAVVEARPAGRKGTLPLVVLSPGFTMSRSSLTSLAEELASRGYVVVGIDHVHESYGTSLPGGRLAGCAACKEQEADAWEFGDKAVRGRQADVSFVLDRLLGRHPVWKGARLIDRSRIGMAGHSLGGSSTPWTMLKDPRVRAGINMDGTFFVPVPDKGLARPFMLMGAGEVHEPDGQDFTWGRDWARMTDWKRWFTVKGGDHVSFTDYPLLTKQSARDLEITRAYVAAFMDRHLRGREQPLLDGPSAAFPEVKLWK